MLIIGNQVEKDISSSIDEDLSQDLSNLLMKVLDKTDLSESQPESQSVIMASIMNLSLLQNYFPAIAKILSDLALNKCD
jgi:hypothetical protein